MKLKSQENLIHSSDQLDETGAFQAQGVISEIRPVVGDTMSLSEALRKRNLIVNLVKKGDYKEAFVTQSNSGISVAHDSDFLEILSEIIKESINKNKIGSQYFNLFYMLGNDFSVNKVSGLWDFMRLVFVTYDENKQLGQREDPLDGIEPLKRLIDLFGDQIDFGYFNEEELEDAWKLSDSDQNANLCREI